MEQQPSQNDGPGFPLSIPTSSSQPLLNVPINDNSLSNEGQASNPLHSQQPQCPPYQHFIRYSSFRESVKKSGIIIPRVTEVANMALRYHESVISRPPGFGKTFIINILESLFLREKSLFQRDSHYTKTDSNGASQFVNKQVGYETNNDRAFSADVKDVLEQWPWNERSQIKVLRFDFSTVLILSNDDESIHEAIIRLIFRVAEMNNLVEQTQLNEFIQSKKSRLKNSRGRIIQSDSVIDYFLLKLEKLNVEYVILIDDADYIMRMNEDYSNRIVIAFYHAILKHSKKYQFLLATCVFPTSIPFVDISQNPDISTVFGFTIKDIYQLEILDEFLEKLKERKAISHFKNSFFQTKSDILNEMEYLYGGYYFSPLSEYSVLNPICVIECIENFSFKNYWIEKALPWSEETLSIDFLNYFTIFKPISKMLFNDVIAKILKAPDDVEDSIRDHYVFLRYFGIFTFSDNRGEAVNNYRDCKIYSNAFNWKVPNVYLYEYLSEMMISYMQPNVNSIAHFEIGNSAEIAIALKSSISAQSMGFYFERGYYDFFVAAILQASGFTIKCHFSQPFVHLTAESTKIIFLINFYRNCDPHEIAGSSFKERFPEGIELSRRCSKTIIFAVINIKINSIHILTCEPNLREILSDSKVILETPYESVELDISDYHPSLPQRNLNLTESHHAQQIDKIIFKKKPTIQNQILDLNNQRNSLNSSLITFLNRRHAIESARNKQNRNDNLLQISNLIEATPGDFLDQNDQVPPVSMMII